MTRQHTTLQQARLRTIWISDVHLGTTGCQAGRLNAFLDTHSCETMYLVGDIIDGWRLKRNFYWPQEHTNVVRKILGQSKHGTQVYWVTGNHDDFLRKFVDYELCMGNIHVVNDVVHETIDRQRLLIVHGDMFDVVTRYHRWVAMLGDVGYRTLLHANRHVNWVRARLGYPYWSLSGFAKSHLKSAVNVISAFEQAVAHECGRRGFDGIVCGHIHHPEIRDMQGMRYYNCGDWVESCTALVEHHDGTIELVDWPEIEATSPDKVTPLSAAARQ